MKTKNFPSYCCQKCGAHIGWLGRFFNLLLPKWHNCRDHEPPNLGI